MRRLAPITLLLLLPAIAHAQTPPSRHLTAVKVDEAPRIDGVLDDAVWREMEPSGDFVQQQPQEGAPARFDTKVWVAYDDAYVYVAGRMRDPEPESVRRTLMRRDTDALADLFAVAFDSYHDRRTAYAFLVYASGVQRDLAIYNDNQGDDRWDAVWRSEVSVDDGGWSAEIAVPLSQLRFNGNPTWGLQFMRIVARDGELSIWQPIPQSLGREVSAYGVMDGLDGLEAPPRLELRPYAAGIASSLSGTDPKDPFDGGLGTDLDVGLDVKYGVGANWTLDATVNPDFGQVEADPAQVNLTDQQLFFEERRPFFLAGQEVFGVPDPGGISLFYSRRIGAAPLGDLDAPEAAEFESLPGETPILGAVKVTGRTPAGTSVGVLEAVTREVRARHADADGHLLPETPVVQPWSNYLVARSTQDLAGGHSQVGATLTAVNRARGSDVLADQLPAGAYAGGLDWNLGFDEKRYTLTGRLLGSHVRGSEAAIDGVQTSFVRYLQRPDADHLSVDPEATHLSGWLFESTFGRTGAEHLTWDLKVNATSPGFEVNDVGFQNRADKARVQGRLIYADREGGEVLQRWQLGSWLGTDTNFGGDFLGADLGIFGYLLTHGYNAVEGQMTLHSAAQDDRLLRGGPLASPSPWADGWVGYFTDPRKRARVGTWVWAGGSTTGTAWYGGGVEVTARPVDALRMVLRLEGGPTHYDHHYVDAYDDPSASDTYDVRYVFSPMDRMRSEAVGRVEWTFSPRLSLQTYVRASVVSGAYGPLEWFERPRTYDFVGFESAGGAQDRTPDGWTVQAPGATVGYEVEDPNFLFTSLQGNAVLRWEWLPGSAAYLVYQLDCSETATTEGAYDPAAWGRLCGGAGASHSLMGKVSWWWSL